MGKLRQLLVGLGLIRHRWPNRTPEHEDRIEDVCDWIEIHSDRNHIVAVRGDKTARLIRQRFAHRGDRVIQVNANRLFSGVFYREDRLALSCTFTLMSEQQYTQLTARLKGEDPLYNVALHPSVKLHDFSRINPNPLIGRP